MKTKTKTVSNSQRVQAIRTKGFQDGYLIAFTDVLFFGGDGAGKSFIRLLGGVSGVYDCACCFAADLANDVWQFTENEDNAIAYLDKVIYYLKEVDSSHEIDIAFSDELMTILQGIKGDFASGKLLDF